MSGLLARKLPVNAPELEPGVLDIIDDETAAVVTALVSDTDRETLAALDNEPETKSKLTDRTEMSIQGVGYHLGRLVDAELAAVVEQCRSEKRRAMGVYAPPVLIIGDGTPSAGASGPPTESQGAVGRLGPQTSD